ncbi:MAG: hypothetical protein ACM3PX_06030 [Omnitrophica WOR_2 bacterium]|jgi:hypothetical protein
MTQILFQKETDVTNDWLFYIENEAKSLAQRTEFSINNYLDREIFNPEMKNFLKTEFIIEMIEKNPEQEFEPLFLNLAEEYEVHLIEDYIKPRFLQLKKIVKQIFQETVADLEEKPLKEIMKRVIYSFIPVFPKGFPTALLPFIISNTAFMIKYGVRMTYPALHY